jgi:hypothetical protein
MAAGYVGDAGGLTTAKLLNTSILFFYPIRESASSQVNGAQSGSLLL